MADLLLLKTLWQFPKVTRNKWEIDMLDSRNLLNWLLVCLNWAAITEDLVGMKFLSLIVATQVAKIYGNEFKA